MKTVQAPASKSVSHRMMVGAALAEGESRVSGVLESKDLERTLSILSSAGAGVHRLSPGEYLVQGVAGKPRGGTEPLSCDAHESGTTCRLLTAVLAAGRGSFRIHGAPRLHERPIGALTDVLKELGVRIDFEVREGFPPLIVRTDGLNGGTLSIGMDESSQYLSGLLLAAPLAKAPLSIELGGHKAVSWPYVGLTLQTLEAFGISCRVEMRHGAAWSPVDWRFLEEAVPGTLRFCLAPAPYRAGKYTVEGDWSGASYLLAAGAVGHDPVRVTGLHLESLQGDRALLDILHSMGARIESTPEGITVFPSPLRGVSVDMGRCPDLVPTVAVLAAHAAGSTSITNVAHLRIKESDRIAAPAKELSRLGIVCEEHEDGLTIHGQPKLASRLTDLSSLRFSSHGDHRIAMSLALLELQGSRLTLDDPACVSKSFPDFWERWKQVRA